LFIADIDARQAILAAAKLPSDCGTLVLKYIGLFSPQSRFLTTSRATTLITECSEMILNGVHFDRDFIQAPSQVWARAFQAVDGADISRPLKNHRYLLRIVQSELGKKHESSSHAAHQSRIAEPRVHREAMQHIGDVGKPEKADPLQAMGKEDRAVLMEKAKADLLDEGFDAQWLAKPLIEQKARELLDGLVGDK